MKYFYSYLFMLFTSLSLHSQQNFHTNFTGEYICEPTRRCSSPHKILIENDTSSTIAFSMVDSCGFPNPIRYYFDMYPNSITHPDSFTLNRLSGLICYLRGRFYPQADSVWIDGTALGCGSGCSCIYQFKCKKVNSTSLSEKELEAVQLFPNPVKESLQIKGLQQRLNYRLYNLQGQLLLNGQVQEGNAIELGKLAPGIYLLQLGEADKSVWHKVVKE